MTDEQIQQLFQRAALAGDLELTALCLIALGDAVPSDGAPGTPLAASTHTRESARARCFQILRGANHGAA